ncbi:MAG: hypothetical protein FJ146_12520 [Deltaproteobacteria bacterium]|nr:hypothetical protein [Deltaproteobacteria bacterium]
MLTAEQIKSSFNALNEELRRQGHKGEIGIVGGSVMCLIYNARAATRDVDAIFEPSHIIRQAAAKIAGDLGLPTDWLNDGAKAYLVKDFARQDYLQLSNLLVWAPEPKYMLAMKCISARWDSSDSDDVIFLTNYLGIRTSQVIFDIIQSYYPNSMIPPKTKFFIEELLQE